MPTLCALRDIPETGGLAVEIDTADGPRALMLFRVGVEVRAYLNVCPHMGRSLDFSPGEYLLTARGELVCPHHGATFDLASGTCVEGPCRGDALNMVKVEVREGEVRLIEEQGRR